MQLNRKKLAFVAAWTMSAVGTVYPESATDHLQRLVEMSAGRLAIAEQIALAKWDSGTPVEDASREAEVIANAVKMGDSRGLDQATTSNFFRAQVEANKLVQYRCWQSGVGSVKRRITLPSISPARFARS
jgi:chorismate mutase